MIPFIDLIRQFHQKKILVIGDFILDKYLHGETQRISPEAPAPVLDIERKASYLGGAGNVAANIRALGGKAVLCTVLERSLYQRSLTVLFKQQDLPSSGIVLADFRKTQVKTRLVARGQILIRFDEGDQEALHPDLEQQLIQRITTHFQDCDAIVIADYEKGLITPNLVNHLKALLDKQPKYIAVDSKRLDLFAPLRPTLVKPNYEQVCRFLGENKEGNRQSHILRLKEEILTKTNACFAAVTLDRDGAIWLSAQQAPVYREAISIEQPQVCGAGDTYLAAAILSLSIQADAVAAAGIAGAASASVVTQSDTAVCHLADMVDELGQEKIIRSAETLAFIVEQQKARNKSVVFTNGCFDLVHCGHTRYLREARKQGDLLIVAVNRDESVQRLKGKSRPINELKDRMDVLAAFSFVDFLIDFGTPEDGDTPSMLIQQLKPDIVVKGEDYKNKDLPEIQAVYAVGAKMVLLPFHQGKSTTNMIRKIQDKKAPDSVIKISSL